MLKRVSVIPTVLVGGALCLAPAAFGQSSQGYRVQLVLHEVQDGKPAATRSYTLMVRPGQVTNLAVGNRVPVMTDNQKYTYQETGLRISATPTTNQSDGSLTLEVSVDITSVAPAGSGSSVYLPTLRTASSHVWAVVPLGKPTMVSSIEDLNSNASYALEVMAVKSPANTESSQLPPPAAALPAAPGGDHPHR